MREKMIEKEKKLYEEIVDRLMQGIQSGELQPGARLPAERALAKEYSVSRAVVREAFRAMEQMGCVESQVGGGTYVKMPEISDVADPFSILFVQNEYSPEELLEARRLLEADVVRLAARRRTVPQLQALEGILSEMEQAVARGETGEEQDIAFHAQLLQAAGNRALELVISTCSEVLNRTMEITQGVEGVPEQALLDHRKILEAITAQDSAKATKYMRKHLLSAQQNLKKRHSNPD